MDNLFLNEYSCTFQIIFSIVGYHAREVAKQAHSPGFTLLDRGCTHFREKISTLVS